MSLPFFLEVHQAKKLIKKLIEISLKLKINLSNFYIDIFHKNFKIKYCILKKSLPSKTANNKNLQFKKY